MIEHFFNCPHCWEQISVLLDPAYDQKYIEDCEICCNPMEITVTVQAGQLQQFNAQPIGQ